MSFYYTVIRNRDDKEIMNDDERGNDYIIYEDFITPNLYIGIKRNNVILR